MVRRLSNPAALNAPFFHPVTIFQRPPLVIWARVDGYFCKKGRFEGDGGCESKAGCSVTVAMAGIGYRLPTIEGSVTGYYAAHWIQLLIEPSYVSWPPRHVPNRRHLKCIQHNLLSPRNDGKRSVRLLLSHSWFRFCGSSNKGGAEADVLVDQFDMTRAIDTTRGETGGCLRYVLDMVGRTSSGLTGEPKNRHSRIHYYGILIKFLHICEPVAEQLMRSLERLLESEALIPPGLIVRKARLAGVDDAPKMLRDGSASNRRIVIDSDSSGALQT
ncbi:hypothetical protein AN3697.2 [Aspergillus nidulans FGSC A4]|nr:hypothetical protein AN3697.2 [Aspergillus nidulans FGSC A4]|eukprot:XP_661301.1 hypothetical protein AN3697.2 [Aspergillus nidulans FGSC A4]